MESETRYRFCGNKMHGGLFRQRLIAEAMISALLLSLLVHVCITSISNSSRRVFSGVVYADPGVPVPGAMVMASGSEGYGYATTNSLGQYIITEGLKTGTYNVSVIADGYLHETVEGVSVTVGQETQNINFYLSRSGGISGRVTDDVSRVPLQNIVIMASTTGGGTYGGQAVTDASGNYRIITNLATGTYNVTALLPEGYIMKTVSGIAVTAGAEVTGVDLALKRSGIISGRVTATPSGAPLEGAMITATSDDEKYVGITQTNATGYYRISSGLGTGTYTVTAFYSIGFGFGQVTGVDVIAGLETPNIDFTLAVPPPSPSGIISGRVTEMDGDPIQDALVTAQGSEGFGETRTDENGDYVISQGLGTGTYTVFASDTGYSMQNVSGVSVTVGQVTPNINPQLPKIPSEQSGRISGTVQGDENPIPEFPTILLVPFFVATTLIVVLATKTWIRRQRPSVR